MNNEEYGILTFNSTHHAISGESIFKEYEMAFKTVPTPREITKSCGLSILFVPDDLEKIRDLHVNDKLFIKGIYKCLVKDGKKEITEIRW